ncbi:hypothetical protein [Leptolyngbya sp. 7M]|uniref:hypothetical protein n=1 Tax=Leptolyngbya sp. 7M TaxID=2812896 RepID=UPI001CED628C|nr:hypothetical protein [Leptolyngbya sp. 7M]
MSPDPNKSSQSSKSASSPKSRTEAQANLAPETSSPAEPMTDQSSKATLITPPTRMTTPDEAAPKPDGPNAVGSNQPSDHAMDAISAPMIPAEPETSEDSVDLTDSDETASQDSDAETNSAEPSASSSEPIAESAVASQATAGAESAEAKHPIRNSDSSEVGSSSDSDVQSNNPTDHQADSQTAPLRQQPIPPASEPMQYRAIGLVRGKYTPSEEQFTRGSILTDDGVIIDAVLLGRVMSLVKKHINLDESHLWVVYPRTRERDLELHMQIVGVWEPEKLNRAGGLGDGAAHADDADEADEADDVDDSDDSDDSELESETELEAELDNSEPTEQEDAEASDPESAAEQTQAESSETADAAPAPAMGVALTPPEELNDRYFSVRGEVVYQSEEEQRLLVKIRRAPKQGTTQARAFKVGLKGTLAGKALGYAQEKIWCVI